MAIVRPLNKFTTTLLTTLFNKLGDDDWKPMSLDNSEIKQYKEKCEPSWKPSKKSTYQKQFKRKNEAASEQLMAKNRHLMEDGLNISLGEWVFVTTRACTQHHRARSFLLRMV